MTVKSKDKQEASVYLSSKPVFKKVDMQRKILDAARIGELAIYIGSGSRLDESTKTMLSTYYVIADEMGYNLERFRRRNLKSGVSIAGIRRKEQPSQLENKSS